MFTKDDLRDPLDFSSTRKISILFVLSIAAWLANDMAAAHLLALEDVAETFGVSETASSDTIGISILGLGAGPLLWNAIGVSMGRRPAFLIAWTCFLGCSLWLSFASTFNSFAAARFFAGFSASISLTLPASIITDIFSPTWRGTAVSTWTLLMTIGPLTAPIISAGLFSAGLSWRWLYYVISMLTGTTWLMIFLLLPETMRASNQELDRGVVINSDKDGSQVESEDNSTQRAYSTFTAEARTAGKSFLGCCASFTGCWYPWREPRRFLLQVSKPLVGLCHATVILPSILYAVIFMWSVGMTVVIPQTMTDAPWSFTNVDLGLVYLAALVGATIGKFAGGFLADKTTMKMTTMHNGNRRPEHRLWSFIPHIFTLALGGLLFGIGLDKDTSWPAIVIGGLAVYFFSTAATSAILQTYVCETNLQRSAHNIATFNMIKNCIAFSAPFFVPSWALEDLSTSYIAQAVITVGLGIIVIAFLLLRDRLEGHQRRASLQHL